jgi:hypothetical protein
MAPSGREKNKAIEKGVSRKDRQGRKGKLKVEGAEFWV